jgi:hypothetical protein
MMSGGNSIWLVMVELLVVLSSMRQLTDNLEQKVGS